MLEAHLLPRRRGVEAANASQLAFPQLLQSLDPQSFNPITQHPFIEDEPVPPTSLQDEVIQVPEHLLPATEDLHHDTLPVEQHPSYPLGNAYWIHHAPHTLQPSGSSQPKLDPRVCSHMSMRMLASSQKEALCSVATGSIHAKSALESHDEEPGPLPYSIDADGHVALAPHLQWRAQMQTTSAAPTWPFQRVGPGPCERSYASLFRVPEELSPDVSVWADLALEELVPRTRPDTYTFPSSLVHPYTQPDSGDRKRQRPSGIPPSLGIKTQVHDDEWFADDDPLHDAAELDADLLDDTSFEKELEDWVTEDMAIDPRTAPSRRVSSVWMREEHEFRRAILSVFEQRDTLRKRPASMSPMPPTSARKRRSLVPQMAETAPIATHTSTPPPWIWGQSRSLRDSAS